MILRVLPFLTIVLIFLSCLQNNDIQSIEIVKNDPYSVDLKSISSNSKKTSSSISLDSCICNWQVGNYNFNVDLTFSNNGQPFSLDSLDKWVDNPDRFFIKSLSLKDFDSIPYKMSIFKNVETIFLEAINHNNIQGLDIFPNLKILKAEGERFIITHDTKWVERVEVIHVNKTKFLGLKTFSRMQNLRELKMSFSGFDLFPNNFESMKCLSYFQSGAHAFGKIDLNMLNLTKMQCLEYIEFQSWQSNIIGIPYGLDRIKIVKINHPNLTEFEKEKLVKYNF